MTLNEIIEETKSLNPVEKLELVDALLQSLDIPTESIEKEIVIEVQSRSDAYKEGLLKSKPIEEVFAKYD